MSGYYLASAYSSGNKEADVILFFAGEDGTMTKEAAFTLGENPSWLCKGRKGIVYAALEKPKEAVITAFKAERKGAWKIAETNRMKVPGHGLCHLCFDKKTGNLYGSCYGSGDFFAVDEALSTLLWQSEKKKRDSHGHCCLITEGRDPLLFTVDPGGDEIKGYELKNGLPDGERKSFSLPVDKGDGPRQLVQVGKEGQLLAVNESGNSLSLYGKASWHRIKKVRATMREGINYPGGAAVLDGDKLFTPNRGADTIAVFACGSGIRLVGEWDCGGEYPRCVYAGLRGLVFSACQKSGEVISYRWNGRQLSICDRLPLPGAACIIELDVG